MLLKMKVGFLGTADYMAEGSGFEAPVLFLGLVQESDVFYPDISMAAYVVSGGALVKLISEISCLPTKDLRCFRSPTVLG